MKNGSGLDSADTGILSNPLSFLRSGFFYWNYASLNSRASSGYYWSLRSTSTTDSNLLNFGSTYLYLQDNNNHGFGIAVRCVSTSKSFTTLVNTSYSMKNNIQTTENNRDSGVLPTPLSFVHGGVIYWDNAGMSARGDYGRYWSLRSASNDYSYYLAFLNTDLNPLGVNSRGIGIAVRSGSRGYKKQGKSPPVREGLIINWHLASFPLLQYNRPYQA